MKKTGILNRDISSVISSMGHQQELVICDAGLPIPDTVRCIDLALEPGLPAFSDVLRVVLKELKVESYVLAEEIKIKSPEAHASITRMMHHVAGTSDIAYLPHRDFKERSSRCRAFIRTGECVPYSNIILVSGVTF